jgi:hypothetical protein
MPPEAPLRYAEYQERIFVEAEIFLADRFCLEELTPSTTIPEALAQPPDR